MASLTPWRDAMFATSTSEPEIYNANLDQDTRTRQDTQTTAQIYPSELTGVDDALYRPKDTQSHNCLYGMNRWR